MYQSVLTAAKQRLRVAARCLSGSRKIPSCPEANVAHIAHQTDAMSASVDQMTRGFIGCNHAAVRGNAIPHMANARAGRKAKCQCQ